VKWRLFGLSETAIGTGIVAVGIEIGAGWTNSKNLHTLQLLLQEHWNLRFPASEVRVTEPHLPQKGHAKVLRTALCMDSTSARSPFSGSRSLGIIIK
jgi:hypothetical protein